MIMDVLQRDDLHFPHSLPEFQQLFPDNAGVRHELLVTWFMSARLSRTRWFASGSPVIIRWTS